MVMLRRWSMLALLSVHGLPLQAQAEIGHAASMLGCYRLRIDTAAGRAEPGPEVFRLDAARPVDWLPTLLRIDAALRQESPTRAPFDTSTAYGPWHRAFPDPWVRSATHLWGSAWRLGGPDTLEVKWSDGFAPINLVFRTAIDTLRGSVHFGSDQVGSDLTLPAVAWRTGCPSAMNGVGGL